MIYLDNNATTSLDPQVFKAMQEVSQGPPTNASSMHTLGRRAQSLLLEARGQIAAILGVSSEEVLFTSGASEALNLAIRGVEQRGHTVISALEHVSALKAAESCQREGRPVTYLYPQQGRGALTCEQIEQALRPDTRLIVVMGANNETGVLSPLEEIAELALARRIPLLVDGVAHVGKEPFTMYPGISMLALTGHKIHGPHGIGLLVVRKGVKLSPLILGGPQQRGRRGGTENLPGIVGLARALEISQNVDFQRIRNLRDRFEQRLIATCPHVLIHGKEEKRVSNTSNIAFVDSCGETLFVHLDLAGVCASFGAACASGNLEPSRVLLSMGVSPEIAFSSLRFSLSRFTTESDIERAASILEEKMSLNPSCAQRLS